jgi:DNA-binding CsgD family transcriptional regulator
MTSQPAGPVTYGGWVGPGTGGSISDESTRVYQAVVRMPQPSRELLLAQGLPAGRVDLALRALAEWGLLVLDGDGSISVPPPAEAMAEHAARLELEASAARASAEGLSRAYHEARELAADRSDLGLEVLADLDAVQQTTLEAVARSTGVVRMFRGMTVQTRELMDAPLSSHRQPSVGTGGRLVELLTVWDSAVLELPAVLPVMAARREGRETQRFLPLFPISVVVVDDQTAVVEWTGSGAGAQGLVGRSPGAVTAGRALFERFWQLGTPMTPDMVPEHQEHEELDERDTTVLRLMAAGVADASIARQAGISQRTVERRVRHVMQRLNASTRFQAGVQASRRGWI